MPWNDKGGENKGPWGSGGGRNQWNGGNNKPPNIEELIRKSQEKLMRLLPKSFGSSSIALGLLIITGLWLSSGAYRVREGEQSVIVRFGEWVRTEEPGLHYHLPFPIEDMIKQRVTEVNRINIGINSGQGIETEKNIFMLTGDENILDVNMTIFWFIKDIGQYLFRSANPESTVAIAAESAVREIIAQTPMEFALTKGKSEIVAKIRALLQNIVDEYEIGIQIQKVDLQKVDAPGPVIDAFRDVQSARADQERMVNEATGYRDSIVPLARAEAEKVRQEAIVYREQTIARAEGESKRFIAIHNKYKRAPDITKKRIYIETMEKIMMSANKVIIDRQSTGVLPFLPLPKLQVSKRSTAG